MSTIKELIRSYDEAAIRLVSEAVEASMPEDAKAKLYAEIYGHTSGGHFNEAFAHEAVSKMYFTAKDGTKHSGPFITVERAKELYEGVKADIPTEYNFWDFFVALQMSVANKRTLLKSWFPNAASEEMEQKYAEIAANFLVDENWPTTSKVWDYLSSAKK